MTLGVFRILEACTCGILNLWNVVFFSRLARLRVLVSNIFPAIFYILACTFVSPSEHTFVAGVTFLFLVLCGD